jgi:hypothetical protein
MKELQASDEQIQKVAGTIDEFATFCGLLGRPENHIMVPSGQYVERQVQTRTEADMVGEMARALTALPRHQAFVKVVQQSGGEQKVWKGKIRTAKLFDAPAGALGEAMKVVEGQAYLYCRPRGEIEEGIRRRQERWRQVIPSRPQAQVQKAARPTGKPVEPPPTRTSARLPTDR